MRGCAVVTLGPRRTALCAFLLAAAGCAPEPAGSDVTAFVGAQVWDGTGAEPIIDAIMLVSDGRIMGVAAASDIDIPRGATVVDLSGLFVIPGLINTHGHVGGTLGLEGGHYTEENLDRQLRLYSAYGITAVNSLGGDQELGLRVRDEDLHGRAHLYVAGAVVTGETVEEALAVVEANAAMGVDWIKIRVDDNLGTTAKMAPEIYGPVIERTHDRGLRLASHLFYLEDAKALLRAGTDFVAHSVRDREVDEEFLELMAERQVCYSPTLTREVSTFVYENTPDFFSDPFFSSRADPEVLAQLSDPERQEGVRQSSAAQAYKRALEVAMTNLKRVADSGVRVAFGTDTGPAGRFQGYFEHMEMALMADAGLTPEQILRSATGDAAACLGIEDIGTLEESRHADFVVLADDPLMDVRNARSIESVWMEGERIPQHGRPKGP